MWCSTFAAFKRVASDRMQDLTYILDNEKARCEVVERMLDEERDSTLEAQIHAVDAQQRLHSLEMKCTDLNRTVENLMMQICELQQRMVDAVASKNSYQEQALTVQEQIAQANAKAAVGAWARAMKRTKANAQREARCKLSTHACVHENASSRTLSPLAHRKRASISCDNQASDASDAVYLPRAAVAAHAAGCPIAGFGGIVHVEQSPDNQDASSITRAYPEGDGRWDDNGDSTVLVVPPPSFKAVAIAALFAVRFNRAGRSKDIAQMWPFGIRYHQQCLIAHKQQLSWLDNQKGIAETALQSAIIRHEEIVYVLKSCSTHMLSWLNKSAVLTVVCLLPLSVRTTRRTSLMREPCAVLILFY